MSLKPQIAVHGSSSARSDFRRAVGQSVCVGSADSVARLASAITASVVSRTPDSNMTEAERAAVRTWAVLTREHPRGGPSVKRAARTRLRNVTAEPLGGSAAGVWRPRCAGSPGVPKTDVHELSTLSVFGDPIERQYLSWPVEMLSRGVSRMVGAWSPADRRRGVSGASISHEMTSATAIVCQVQNASVRLPDSTPWNGSKVCAGTTECVHITADRYFYVPRRAAYSFAASAAKRAACT